MDPRGWAEIALTLAVTVALAWPLGIYMARVWMGERTWLDPVLKPVERAVYAACGVKPEKGQNWVAYAMSLLAFSVASFVVLYLILRFQNLLPLNPQGFAGLSPHLSFNTAVSFVTNTNWQSYVPEQTLSTFSQMAGLTSHNFLSAAAGIAVAAALARAFANNRSDNLGDFWVDLTRISLYILLPISLVIAIAYVGLGEPQSLLANVTAHTVEGGKQAIALYPTASQEAIKQLGTNGGGIFNANSAHPFENPNAITNLIEIVSMNALSLGCVVAFGRLVLARPEARAIVAAMVILVSGGAAVIYAAETQPAPALAAAHVDTSVNMEGKEVRFGAPSTAIWAAATTGASDGGVNGMHDSFMPLGGGMAMFLIQLGEILPGGVGSGLYGMVVMALIAVFVAVEDRLAAALVSNTLDVVISGAIADDNDIVKVTEHRFSDLYSVIASTTHPLTGRQNLSMRDLADMQWVMPPEDAAPRRLFHSVIEELGVPPPVIRVETRSPAAIKSLVAGTQFLGWLPEPLFAAERAAGLIAPLAVKELSLARRFYVYRRRQTFVAPPVLRFLEELRNVAPGA